MQPLKKQLLKEKETLSSKLTTENETLSIKLPRVQKNHNRKLPRVPKPFPQIHEPSASYQNSIKSNQSETTATQSTQGAHRHPSRSKVTTSVLQRKQC